MSDSTEIIQEHREQVYKRLNAISQIIEVRGLSHDLSKLREPEKSVYDEYAPKLAGIEYGSEEYKANLAAMETGLAHHYLINRHHPQHFSNGVDGMSLIDVIEMVCDWHAAAARKGYLVNVARMAERFNISPQLASIIQNTLDQALSSFNPVIRRDK